MNLLFVAVFIFAGILTRCLPLLLLVILIVHFPPLLSAILLARWIFCRLVQALAPGTATRKPDVIHRCATNAAG